MSVTTAIVQQAETELAVAGSGSFALALKYARASKAPSTLRAYVRDWRDFESWCASTPKGPFQALPAAPFVVAEYIAELAEPPHVEGQEQKRPRKIASIERALAAITFRHRSAGHASPRKSIEVEAALDGIGRVHGVAQRKPLPLTTEQVRKMSRTLPATLRGVRDRAMLVLGYAGAFRRAELVSLDVSDLTFTEDGVVVRLRRSKTDQHGEGFDKPISPGSYKETCPVRAVKAWLEHSGIMSGPLFRQVPNGRAAKVSSERSPDKTVDRIVKRTMRAAGMSSSGYSAHSLRAGFVTTADKNGKSMSSIMATTGHKSTNTVAGYIRRTHLFDDNASAALGL